MVTDDKRQIPSLDNIRTFRRRLMYWYNEHRRKYPWRDSDDPFKVLIAEMMLRRTRADQVEPVYKSLFTRYPDVRSLAEGEPDEIKAILQPLGLRWRIPSFQKVARVIVRDYRGQVPSTRDELQKLSGVGDYVAGAVLSVAYKQKQWIVDSNVVRVFQRYFGMNTTKEGRRDRHVITTAMLYAASTNPKKANLAILDFAALVCTSKQPKHERCPLKIHCQYFNRQQSTQENK